MNRSLKIGDILCFVITFLSVCFALFHLNSISYLLLFITSWVVSTYISFCFARVYNKTDKTECARKLLVSPLWRIYVVFIFFFSILMPCLNFGLIKFDKDAASVSSSVHISESVVMENGDKNKSVDNTDTKTNKSAEKDTQVIMKTLENGMLNNSDNAATITDKAVSDKDALKEVGTLKQGMLKNMLVGGFGAIFGLVFYLLFLYFGTVLGWYIFGRAVNAGCILINRIYGKNYDVTIFSSYLLENKWQIAEATVRAVLFVFVSIFVLCMLTILALLVSKLLLILVFACFALIKEKIFFIVECKSVFFIKLFHALGN